MACNTGISSIPRIDGTAYEFRVCGLHNGLALMEDLQTRSYWDHTTGECIHGPLRGKQLPEVQPLRYVGPRNAVRNHPDARIALSKPTLRQRLLERVFLNRMLTPKGHLPFLFAPSMSKGDERRPRMELGLGVWWPGTTRFYPMETIQDRGNALVDTVGDRRVLVFLDPGAHAPVAAHTEAHECRWEGDVLVLDDGGRIEGLQLEDASGLARPLEMFPHLFTRWYGFSATFPGCDVYGE